MSEYITNRNIDEVEELYNRALDNIDLRKYPAMSYEDGIIAAFDFLNDDSILIDEIYSKD